MASKFSEVPLAPPVEIFLLNQLYKEDKHDKKVDLGIGAYRTNEGTPWVLPVVREAEKEIAKDDTLNHEYLSILGMEPFSRAATALLLGEDSIAIKDNRTVGVQALSGTGALRLGLDFLVRILKVKTIYTSEPTWGNHNLLFKHAGFGDIRTYKYWNPETRGLDFEGFINDLKNAPEESCILLHACAHNPTGVDPSEEQWKEIGQVIKERNLFTFFDCAYQGFATGDLVRDSWAVRHFVSLGLEMFCAQSFAKNFGLYNERIGNLTIVFKDPSLIANTKSQLTLIVRGNYSNPPCHGARIVHKVLTNAALREKWHEHIKEMSSRIIEMRKQLREQLEQLNTPGTWSHITSQIGMFSYTGLTPEQVKYLIDEYHIYIAKNGRISLCGINKHNLEYVASAFHDAVTMIPS